MSTTIGTDVTGADFIDNEELMEEVRKHPSIYDKSSREYRDGRIRSNAWKEIELALGVSIPGSALKRYSTIRTRFSKYLRDLQLPSGSGTASIILKPEYESLRWLITHITHKKTTITNYNNTSSNSAYNRCNNNNITDTDMANTSNSDQLESSPPPPLESQQKNTASSSCIDEQTTVDEYSDGKKHYYYYNYLVLFVGRWVHINSYFQSV